MAGDILKMDEEDEPCRLGEQPEPCQIAGKLCELHARQLKGRSFSLDSARTAAPSSTSSGSSDDTTSSGQFVPEDDLSGPSVHGVAEDVADSPKSHTSGTASWPDKTSPTSLMTPRIVPGMCIRVWRWKSNRMEWSEVIRRTTSAGKDWYLCETLLSEIFEFCPELVAKGCDDAIEAYDIAHEDSSKVIWRQQEVARLHSTISSQGQLGSLPAAADCQSPGFIVAPSQFHVKATFVNCTSPEKHLEIQEAIEQQLLQYVCASCQERPALGRRDDHTAGTQREVNVAENNPLNWKKCLQAVGLGFWHRSQPMDREVVQCQCVVAETYEAKRAAETTPRHLPELCSECIRKATWCSGSAHLPNVTTCLHAAAAKMYSGIIWSPFEGGIEAEVEHESGRLLLQIRPHLFFITEIDAKLFG